MLRVNKKADTFMYFTLGMQLTAIHFMTSSKYTYCMQLPTKERPDKNTATSSAG